MAHSGRRRSIDSVEAVPGRVKRVVLFITDGLGWQLLQEIAAADPTFAQVIADLTGDGTLTPLTSIAPTTTASALPTIWCGATPIATGLLGTQLFLREYSTLASMLHFAPVAGKHRADALEDWGLDLTTLLPQKTLSEALRQHRIPSYLLLQKDMIGSGLSRVMHRGVENVILTWLHRLWINLRDLSGKRAASGASSTSIGRRSIWCRTSTARPRSK